MLSARAFLFASVRMNKLVNRNVKHGNELYKKVETRILSFVLDIHNGTGVTVYQFRNIGLRPALFFSGLFESRPEAVKVKPSFILVHSHITLYHCTFRVGL